MTTTGSTPSRAALSAAQLASIDLSGYDPEQSRLMDERCILVDEDDTPLGAADKKTCHLMENINKGLLHRAFSAFVFRPSDGRLLLQQRASEKITFPDMWTNTCCSHPLDDFEEEKEMKEQRGVRVAASRKLEHELGIPQAQTPIDDFQYLTRIHYLAPSDGLWGSTKARFLTNTINWGTLANTVYTASLVDYILFLTADVDVTPNLNEIRDYKYVSKEELQAMFEDKDNTFTPWFKLIARDFLFGWWDILMERKDVNGRVVAKSLAGVADGSKVVKMV
ncbi:Isopentenyldiphosphate isomerase [Pyrrhoderma noxium]|uniref:isopentenyl-diphosphate Delta-isomerase n=1 Tax=Pyrrhoderma noxium TaxID=2282107 RepID=A0A286UQW5_9AGAM|nr:Isopentenyldiphosphate isomerase [Pyrrhoderma noxium]